MTRRPSLSALTCALALALTACAGEDRTADPDHYPDRPVTMLVGFAPGGGTDTIARTIARCLNSALGREVVVENKPGGSQAIALNDLLNAPADGHTMAMVTTSGPVVVPLRVPTVGYDKGDFTPLNEVAHAPSVLITPAGLHEEVAPGFLDREDVLVVSTAGEYKYVGRLTVEFSRSGRVVAVDDLSFTVGRGRITGFEALVRWPHPERGMIPPSVPMT
jgi:hypothetical protein